MVKTARRTGKRAATDGRVGARKLKSSGSKGGKKVRPQSRKPSVASENARLKSQLENAKLHQLASAEILRAVANAAGDVGRPLQEIAETTARLFGAQSVAIQLAEGQEFTQEYRVGAIAKRVGSAYPRSNIKVGGRNLPGTVVAESRQIHIPDLDHLDPSMSDFPGLPHARAGGARTVSGTPLRREGKAIGALIVLRDKLLPFTDDELALQQSFADQAVIAIENARLFNETREALERQTATADILRVISASPTDVQPVFDALVLTARRLLRRELAFIIRRDDTTFHPVAIAGPAGLVPIRNPAPIPIDPSANFPSRAIVSKTSQQFPDWSAIDLPEEERKIRKLYGLNSALYLPMLRGEECIGVLGVGGREPGSFSEADVALAESFCDQALIAIENARLFNEVQAKTSDLEESLRQQTATSEVLEVISNSPGELQPVFEAVLENATRICDARFGTLLRFDGNAFHFAADVGTPAALAEYVRRPGPFEGLAGGMIDRIHRTRQVQHSADYAADAAPGLAAKLGGARSTLGVPILRDDVLVGAIVIYRQEVRPFSAREIELVRSFAAQAAIAIENARLFNETREALAQQKALADILSVISNSVANAEPVFDEILRSVRHLFDVEDRVIFLSRDDVLHVGAIDGPNANVVRDLFPVPLRGTASEIAMRERRLIAYDDVLNDPGVPDGLRAVAARFGQTYSMATAPLLTGDRALGALVVARVNMRPFAEKECVLLQTFADQAVIAIQNARLFDEVQAKTRDLEESLQQQTATADVLKVISRSAFDLDAVMNTLARSAAELCSASLCGLHIREGDFLVCRGYAGATKEQEEFVRQARIPADDMNYLMSRVLSSCEVANLGNIGDFGSLPVRTFQEKLGFNSLLMVPLTRQGRGIGLFVLGRPCAGEFSSRHIELVQTFADQAVIAIENARLFNETREALERQTATSEILRIISQSPSDVTPVFDAIAERARVLCGALLGATTRFDGELLHLVGYHGVSPEAEAVMRSSFPRKPDLSSINGRCILAKAPVQIADVETDPHYRLATAARAANYRSLVAVPMLQGGDVIGVIAVTRKEPSEFSAKLIDLLQTFADQAVIAIENVRLFDEVQARTRDLEESLQQQTATADVLKIISRSAFDLQAVFDTLTTSAVDLLGVHSGTMCVRDGDVFRYRSAAGAYWTDELWRYLQEHPVTPGRNTAAGRVILSGRIEQIPDIFDDPEYAIPMKALTPGHTPRSILSVPLLGKDRVEGAMVLSRQEAGPFTQREVDILQTFADQGVIAIENARLFEEVQARTRELARSLDDLRAAQDRLVQTEKLASLGQLTAGIAHEIKNPLNFVNNFSSLSAELVDELDETLAPAPLDQKTRGDVGELTQMLKSNLEKVVQHGKRADSIVKNMLQHSREGSGEHRTADINAIVEDSLNLAYHGARAEKSGFTITLRHDLDPHAGVAELYPQEITRALLNLISNGFYAAMRRKIETQDESFEPILSAATKGLDNKVEIRIRDNGTGIPTEVKEKMFNPFFTTKPTGEGTGLGLSMTHDIIVKQHGGTIDVVTEPGVFTEFIVTLPRG